MVEGAATTTEFPQSAHTSAARVLANFFRYSFRYPLTSLPLMERFIQSQNQRRISKQMPVGF